MRLGKYWELLDGKERMFRALTLSTIIRQLYIFTRRVIEVIAKAKKFEGEEKYGRRTRRRKEKDLQ